MKKRNRKLLRYIKTQNRKLEKNRKFMLAMMLDGLRAKEAHKLISEKKENYISKINSEMISEKGDSSFYADEQTNLPKTVKLFLEYLYIKNYRLDRLRTHTLHLLEFYNFLASKNKQEKENM